jgi:hypothetical protein
MPSPTRAQQVGLLVLLTVVVLYVVWKFVFPAS